MFISIAINEVNSEVKKLYNLNLSTIPVYRVYYIYMQYFANSITLSEAAEDVYGVLFDNELIS